MELSEKLKEIKDEQQLIVEVNREIPDSLNLLLFQQNSLLNTLYSVRENKYGLFNENDLKEILYRLDKKERERQDFILSVGQALLGENVTILDELGLAYRIDLEKPVVVFFKVNR